MATMQDEPFFRRFMRELVRCEKTALHNPAQMLRLLTGQDSLHHPFVVVKDRCHRVNGNSHAAPVKLADVRRSSRKTCQNSLQMEAQRQQKAVKKSNAAVSDATAIWSLLPQLELKQHPKAVLKLLFDIFLGCGRPIDDLRKLTNVKGAIPSCPQQLGVVLQTIGHIAAAIRASQPIQVEFGPDDIDDLQLALLHGTDRGRSLDDICARWVARLASPGSCAGMSLQGRRLRFLRLAANSVSFRPGRQPREVAAELAAKQPRFFITLARGTGRFWTAHFTARMQQTHKPDFHQSLVDLSCQLCVLIDIAASEAYADLRDQAAEELVLASQSLAYGVMRKFVQQKKATPLRDTINDYRLQAELLGSLLPPQPQKTDARVPWPLDEWQIDLLDAVDTRAGALVLAPPSAGKTFAAYYAMESVLRASNKAAVLVVLPTATLAGQVEAEVYARFGQKPYPHNGFELCAALLPGRSRQHVKRAQIIVAVPQSVEEVLDDEALWRRMSWLICDEIHMQPLKTVKRLCERAGSVGSAVLAMSATVQRPLQLRISIAEAVQNSAFSLVKYTERAVHLQAHWWNSHERRIVPLHPLLLQDSGSVSKERCLPLMSPSEALQLWEAMALVDSEAAESLDLKHTCRHWKHRLVTRDEFRKWERCLAASLVESDRAFQAQVALQLMEQSPIGQRLPTLDSHGLLQLLMKLRESDMLPCICFHLSPTHLDRTLLELEAILSSSEKAREEATADSSRQARMELRSAWEQEVAALRLQLEVAEKHARDRQCVRQKRGRTAGVTRRDEDDFRAPEVLEQDRLELTAEASERADAADVSADAEVRVARAALQAVLQRGPLDVAQLDSKFSFVTHGPYAAEIRTLLAVVEDGINEIATRSRQRLWAQSVLGALNRGVALHIDDEGYDWINFAVLMLFRLGHVKVLLAGEALGCGVNLPCRTVVVLDSDIAGARLKQFAGRAGRRGLDLAGSSLFVHGLEALRQMHR